VTDSKNARSEAEKRERNRLLYVAMTRAESWLIVCGKEPGRNADKSYKTWHDLVCEGMKRAGAVEVETEGESILRLSEGTWPDQMAPRKLPNIEPGPQEELPELFALTPPSPKVIEAMVSPSDLGGAKILAGGAMDEGAAKRRGRQIHLLFEHLANAPSQDAAERLLAKGPDRAEPAEVKALFEEVQRNFAAHPQLFDASALAEVDVCAMLPTLSRETYGTIDRLLITEDRITVVDFKTNAVVPERPDEVPESILRQMGAYLEALEQIWTDRPIDVAVLWTTTAELMVLSHGIVRAALQRATTS
jgi:ATP-dependent helicase/nuclease subunit A